MEWKKTASILTISSLGCHMTLKKILMRILDRLSATIFKVAPRYFSGLKLCQRLHFSILILYFVLERDRGLRYPLTLYAAVNSNIGLKQLVDFNCPWEQYNSSIIEVVTFLCQSNLAVSFFSCPSSDQKASRVTTD